MRCATAAEGLTYRDFMTVALVVPVEYSFPDNWIYIHDPGVKVGRIQNFGSWSPYLVKEGRTCLGLEFFVNEGDDMWTKSDEELVEQGKRELQALGLADASKVEAGYVVRMPKAYPVYDEHYKDNVGVLREWIAANAPNIMPTGSNGMHKYNNQDHSMMTAILSVDNIFGAHNDVWSVNVEDRYHEVRDDAESRRTQRRAGNGTRRARACRVPPSTPRGSATQRGSLMRVQVCTPTYIEAENIEEFLRRARAALPDADILVLDDNSPDGTADIAERVAAELGQIEVLRRPEKRGLGNAYRAGFAVGIARGYEVICQIDADLSHDPEVLPELIGAIECGRRSRHRVALRPRWSDPALAVAPAGHVEVREHVHGLHAAHRRERRRPRATGPSGPRRCSTSTTPRPAAKGYGFQIELAYRVAQGGGKIVEVPITFTDRVRGHSKMSMAVMVEEMALVSWWGIRDRFRHRRN